MSKISKLIEKLERAQEQYGDVEVYMQGTVLSNYKEHGVPVIFDSTVETILPKHIDGEQVIQMYWQC